MENNETNSLSPTYRGKHATHTHHHRGGGGGGGGAVPLPASTRAAHPSNAQAAAAAAAPPTATPQPPVQPPPPPPMILDPATNTWYRTGEYLGKGGFAVCYKTTDTTTNKEYALKIVQKSSLVKKATERKLRSEIEIHKKLVHRHVVRFYKSFETADAVYMILGLAENQTLMDMMKTRKRLTEPEVQVIGLQFISALKYLHSTMNVIHRDLKLGNVLINKEMDICLADFGLAATLDNPNDRRKTVCGTPNYLAPEILEGGQDGHSFEVDIWSLGVVLYTLLVGKPPFETTNMKATYKKIKNVNFVFPDEPVVSDSAKSLIRWVLTKQPDHRPSLQQIERHAFFCSPTPPSALPVSALSRIPSFPPSLMRANSSSTLTGLETGMARMMLDPAPQHRGDEALMIKWIHDNIERAEMSAALALNPFHDGAAAMPTTSASAATTPQRPLRTGVTNTIVCWVDLIHTWGLGYLLSNGVMGIRFNDSTVLVWALESKYFWYYENKTVPVVTGGTETPHGVSNNMTSEVRYMLDEGGFPTQLSKKVKLIATFKEVLLKECKPGMVPTPAAHLMGPNGSFETLDWVKKHIVTKHCVLMLLNSGPLAVKFMDHSEVIFSHVADVLVYVTRSGDRNVLTTDQAMNEQRKEVMQRVKYIRSVLRQILDAKRPGSSGGGGM